MLLRSTSPGSKSLPSAPRGQRARARTHGEPYEQRHSRNHWRLVDLAAGATPSISVTVCVYTYVWLMDHEACKAMHVKKKLSASTDAHAHTTICAVIAR